MIMGLQRIPLLRKSCLSWRYLPAGSIPKTQSVHDAIYPFQTTSSPDCSCVRLSEGKESRNGEGPNHVCPPEVSKSFVGKAVCSLFPYFSLTENDCCFDLSDETLMLLKINITFPGSSVAYCPPGAGANLGRRQNRERASQI